MTIPRFVNGWLAVKSVSPHGLSRPTLPLATPIHQTSYSPVLVAFQLARIGNNFICRISEKTSPNAVLRNPRLFFMRPVRPRTSYSACTPCFVTDCRSMSMYSSVLNTIITSAFNLRARYHYSSKSSSSSTPSSSMKPLSSAVIFSPGARPARDLGWLTLGIAG